jgi:hypothetical protein
LIKYLWRLPQQNESWYAYPGCLLFMWGVFPSFRYRVSVAASQKNLFRHSKNGKSTFRGTKRKSASVAFLKGHARVRYGRVPTNYAMFMAECSSFILEVMQSRTW